MFFSSGQQPSVFEQQRQLEQRERLAKAGEVPAPEVPAPTPHLSLHPAQPRSVHWIFIWKSGLQLYTQARTLEKHLQVTTLSNFGQNHWIASCQQLTRKKMLLTRGTLFCCSFSQPKPAACRRHCALQPAQRAAQRRGPGTTWSQIQGPRAQELAPADGRCSTRRHPESHVSTNSLLVQR